ncbi:MAG: WG repeat-containing protein [Clostridia bacterium]|nr:WG repeat-containing protein [Clostridia bacterium]
MNLIGEQFVPNKPDKTKTTKKIIIALIIIVVIAIIAVMIGMVLVKQEKMSVKLNGEENAELKSLLQIDENKKIHIPIREIASLLGYKSYNGNYLNKSEDTNECYIESNEEVVMFTVGSDKIEKINSNNQTSTFRIDEPVQMIDGKLCTTPNGISQSYNVNFSYDEELKNINISSMQYLIEAYKNTVIEAGFTDISTKFNDQKAILKGLVIVKDNKGRYGIYDLSTNKTVLETKYSNIQYLPISDDFLVESNGKIGIIERDGTDKIKIQYDSIELINQNLKLYVVKKDGKYGVINQTEDVIIPMNCDKIGIETTAFAKNNIKNKYVLLDKIIPVMKNNLWGLYDIEGNELTELKYNSLGCTSSGVKNTENVLIIPDYNVIIGCKDKKYYLINQYGEELFNGIEVEAVYMTIDLDEVNYYVIRNSKKYDAIELLESLKKQGALTNNTEKENQRQEENEDEEDEKQRQEENDNEQNRNQRQEENENEQNENSRQVENDDEQNEQDE